MMTRLTPLSSHAATVADVADAATKLERHLRGGENALDRGGIDRLAGKGAVEIDDMQIFKALRRKGACLRRRIAMKHRRARHVALLQPHAGAVLEIDGRKQDHGVHFRKLPISANPSRWLFSG